jgi:hypothetical protein
MYLQVTTVLDLCNADGATTDEALNQGKLDAASSTSSWLHFNQGRPSSPAWILWRHVLTYWFDSEGILYEPLGPWLLPANQLRRDWPAYFDSSDDCVYIRHLPKDNTPDSQEPTHTPPYSTTAKSYPGPPTTPRHQLLYQKSAHMPANSWQTVQ